MIRPADERPQADSQPANGSAASLLTIAGAGCAGTALALRLLDYGYPGEIHLHDQRQSFDREQRWCFWGPAPEWLSPVVRHSWKSWNVQSAAGDIIIDAPTLPYQEIYGPDYFAWAQQRLRQSPRVHFHLGEALDLPSPNQQMEPGKYFVDATGSATHCHADYWQSFLGWEVEWNGNVLDAHRATIMDHRAEGPGVTFGYILPYSARRGLIELTCFDREPITRGVLEEQLQRYLAQYFPSRYSIRRREAGRLPMGVTGACFAAAPQHYRIGSAGGALRPSSGYGFLTLCRQADAAARAICKLPASYVGRPTKYNALDAIFLRVLQRQPDFAGELFGQLFQHTPPDSLVRFLSDQSTWRDDLRVIAALPKWPFLRAVL